MVTEDKIIFREDDEFVCYSLPGEQDYKLAPVTSSKTAFEVSAKLDYDFLISPFNRKKEKSYFLKLGEEMINMKFDFITNSSSQLKSTSFEQYSESFNSAMGLILSGELDKIVLSKLKVVDVNIDSWYDYYLSLVRAYPDAFVFFINLEGMGTWIGASPEILLTKTEDLCRTVALAGTRQLVEGNKVKWSAKEIEEQKIIVEYLDEYLKGNNVVFKHSNCYTIRAGKMAHLRTDFIIKDNGEIEKLVEIIHPGPALCGRPRDESLKRLEQIETYDRTYYTGFLGPVFKNGEYKFYVNLRCMQIFKNNVCLYLGGGITSASDLKSEWEETELKATTLLDHFPGFKNPAS